MSTKREPLFMMAWEGSGAVEGPFPLSSMLAVNHEQPDLQQWLVDAKRWERSTFGGGAAAEVTIRRVA